MKKNLTKSRLMGYLLLLTAASFGVISMSYARYTSQVTGEGTATVALWGSDATITQTFPVNVEALTPGGNQSFDFMITNTKEGKISQVAQEYSIKVETTGNLPLEFTLASKDPTGNASNDGSFVTTGAGGKLELNSNTAEATGGFLPHTNLVTHKYTLTVTWPTATATTAADGSGTGGIDGSDDAKYADEIDLVTLTVSAVQALPKETS